MRFVEILFNTLFSVKEEIMVDRFLELIKTIEDAKGNRAVGIFPCLLVLLKISTKERDTKSTELVRELGISQKTVTDALSVLKGAGLVTSTGAGRSTYYLANRSSEVWRRIFGKENY